MKDCVEKRRITYCFEYLEYPCKQIKGLEKSYNTRYHTSLMENSQMVKEQGMAGFLTRQKRNIPARTVEELFQSMIQSAVGANTD